MPYTVLYDPEKELGALVDTEAGRALGPVLAGPAEVVVRLLDTFVGAVGADPATLHPFDLDHAFRGFLTAIAEDEAGESGGAAGSAEDADAPAGAPSAPAAAEPAGDESEHVPQEGQPNEPEPAHTAAPGEQGQVAGAVPGEGVPAETAAAQGEPPPAGEVATGALAPSHERAAPAPDQPGGDEQPAGGGIPKAPGV